MKTRVLANPDLRLTLAMNRLARRRPILSVLRLASRLGDGMVWYGLILAMALFGGDQGPQAALHLGLVALFVAGLYRLLKDSIRRPRPFRSHHQVIARIRPLDEFSFPSGHTLHAVSLTLVALHYAPALAWLLLPLSSLIAISRIALGMHYPSDVLAAAAIGAAIASISLALLA
ncbi:MAG: phosphatase PAP2 family protein [Xanthomonadales bacterium]|nr:phosphatase PAP2 family protein [Xanthomonadales bacterium]